MNCEYDLTKESAGVVKLRTVHGRHCTVDAKNHTPFPGIVRLRIFSTNFKIVPEMTTAKLCNLCEEHVNIINTVADPDPDPNPTECNSMGGGMKRKYGMTTKSE